MRYLTMVGLVFLIIGSGLLGPASDTFAISGSWSTLALNARMDATMAYDNYADRFVFFGGWDGYQKFNEVWQYWPGYYLNAWQKMPFSPSNPLPAARNGHTLIWDPGQRRLILFGGKDSNNSFLNDVWALPLWTWDAQNQVWQYNYAGIWQQLTTTGAVPGLTQHTAVLDSQRGRMLVYGGEKSDGTLSDQLYSLDLQTLTWSALTIPTGGATGPFGRQEHVAIYDASDDALFVYGGEQYHSGSFSWASPTLWRLRLSTQPLQWDIFVSQVAVAPCVNGGAIYDSGRNEMVIYGGNPGQSGPAGGAAIRVPLAVPSGVINMPLTMSLRRESFAYVYDNLRDKMQIFGGSEGVVMANGAVVPRNDTWNLTLGTSPAWNPTYERPYGGTWFSDASMVYDDQHGRTIMFGGYTGFNGPVNGVFAVGLSGYVDQWATPNLTGTPPSARYDHSAIYDRTGDRMVVYGGSSNTGDCSDLWALNRTGGQDLSSNNYQWVQLPNVGGPGPLSGHSAVYAEISPTNRKMIIFGGRLTSNGTLKSETWSYDLVNQTWQQLSTTGQAPAARADHAAVYDYSYKRMFIFGGVKSTGATNEVYYLDITTNVWAKAQFTGPKPAARSNMTVVLSPYADFSMIVFGGISDQGALLSDAWSVRVLGIQYGASWSQITPTGVLPGDRQGQVAVYQGAGHVLVAGGRWYSSSYQLDELFNDTWTLAYDTGYYSAVKVRPTGDPDQPTGPGHGSGVDVGMVGKLALNVETLSRSQARIHVSLDGDPDNPTGTYAMEAYDVSGRLVRRWDVQTIAVNGGQTTWDLTDNRGVRLPAGMYFIRLKGQKSSVTQRIVALH